VVLAAVQSKREREEHEADRRWSINVGCAIDGGAMEVNKMERSVFSS
jgi:hypothetical protein